MIILEIKAKLDDGSEHLRVINLDGTLQQIDGELNELEKNYIPNENKCKWITIKYSPLHDPHLLIMK